MMRRIVWVATGVLLAIVLVLTTAKTVDDARVIAEPQPERAAVGTFQYTHVEGPFLVVWNTQTGEAHLCMIQETGVVCK